MIGASTAARQLTIYTAEEPASSGLTARRTVSRMIPRCGRREAVKLSRGWNSSSAALIAEPLARRFH